MVEVFQVQISDIGFESVESIEIWRKMMFGAKNWNEEYWNSYSKVAEVDTEELNEVFDVMNGMGDTSIVKRLVHKTRSASAGDIFVRNGKRFIVDTFGFAEID